MFMGKFLQFPPITDTPLFSTNIQPTFTFTKSMQKKIMGKSIWENYFHQKNIILTQQVRQNKDIKYVTLLQNLQNGIISNSNFDV